MPLRRLFAARRSAISLLVLLCAAPGFALHARSTRHFARPRHRRGVVWTPLLRGSHESMLRQNEEIDRLGLPRIADEQQLESLIQRRELIPIRENNRLRIHPDLQPENRYCKPWTLTFLNDLSQDFYTQFHEPIQVNSAVRTMEQQHLLRRHNHNAAPDSGDTPSSHLAGLTVDISRRGLSRKERKWIEQYLYRLHQRGLVETAEERRQPVFHIMVSQRYSRVHTAALNAFEHEPAPGRSRSSVQ
jgi:hypothetical protein